MKSRYLRLFTFNMPGNTITQLMGVAVPDAQVRIIGSKLTASGPLLITHWGMSGPVILRLSAWGARELAAGNYQFTIGVNWLTAYNENSLREAMQDEDLNWLPKRSPTAILLVCRKGFGIISWSRLE